MSHALLSPSSAHRWSRCLGSVEATKDFERVDTEYSKEGTLAHEIAAWALRENKPVDKHPEHKKEWGSALQGYVDRCRGLRAEVWRVEQQLSLDPHFPGQFGTADYWGFLPEYARLHVRDLKFGVGDVVYANYIEDGVLRPNEQLLLYGFGAYLDCSMVFDNINEVTLEIDQPRREHISTITLTVPNMLAEIERLSKIAKEILADPIQELTPGEKQCRWCPARATCGARADQHLKTFLDAIESDQGAAMHSDDLVKWLAQLSDMEQWIHDVREEATRRLKNGIEVGGWKLVEGRARRVWNDSAIEVLPMALGDSAWKPREIIGITEAEKLLGKNAKDLMPKITNRMPGAPTLAGPDDKRPALRLSAAEVFNDANPDTDMLG